jgi:hypothetical protein
MQPPPMQNQPLRPYDQAGRGVYSPTDISMQQQPGMGSNYPRDQGSYAQPGQHYTYNPPMVNVNPNPPLERVNYGANPDPRGGMSTNPPTRNIPPGGAYSAQTGMAPAPSGYGGPGRGTPYGGYSAGQPITSGYGTEQPNMYNPSPYGPRGAYIHWPSFPLSSPQVRSV